jgi:hypothetical protein
MIRIRGKESGVNETSSAVNQIPSLLVQAGMGAMTEALELVSTILRKEHMEGPYPEEIQSRTGSLRSTFRRGHKDNIFDVKAEGTKIVGTFGSQDKRARILNEGGVIRPRHAQYLAVRTEFTKTAGGVVREKYRGPLRQVPHTFVRMGDPKGPRFARGTVFEKIGKKIIPIAWLVKYVLIKGRQYVQKTVAKATPRIPPIFERRFGEVLTRWQQTLQRFKR